MGIPEVVGVGVTTAAALQIGKQAQDFIVAAFGHPGESLGSVLGSLSRRRQENLDAVVNRAGLTLLDIGATPQQVPLQILYPALEAASLQEDCYLQEKWADLLANAADPRKQNPVEPSFPEILKQLSAREARFLDGLFQQVNGIFNMKFTERELMNEFIRIGLAPSCKPITLAESFGGREVVPPPQYRLMMTILESQRILEKRAEPMDLRREDVLDLTNTKYDVSSVNLHMEEYYSLTDLGIALIRACQVPTL